MDNDRRLALAGAGLAGAALLTHLTGRASAGPVNPSAGPVASTGRTLSEIYDKIGGPSATAEPRTPLTAVTTPGGAQAVFKITQPGSYYLPANLIGAGDKPAIMITADDVTIDLNGFAIIGNGPIPPFAVTIDYRGSNLTIRNGAIKKWGAYTFLGSGRNMLIEDLAVIGPFHGNLESGFDNSIIRRVRLESSGEVGITVGENSLVEDCVVMAMDQGLGVGISATFSSVISRCTVHRTGRGIDAFNSCLVDRCAVYNTTDTSQHDSGGIVLQNSTARNCHVGNTLNPGIRLMGGGTAIDNSLTTCAIGIANGAFAGGRNRIEGNHAAFCGQGFKIDNPRNFVARNTASQSTTADFVIAAGNTVGEIIDATAGATLTNATSPWANIRC